MDVCQDENMLKVEHRCMGLGIDPERVSRSEKKKCSCFEGNFLVRCAEGNATNLEVVVIYNNEKA